MLKHSLNLIIFLLVIYNSGAVAQTAPELILPETLNGAIKIKLSATQNFNEEKSASDKLAVFVKNVAEKYGANPIQGQYKIEGNYLQFKPYFPFEKGIMYIVRLLNTKADSTYSYQSFQIGKKKIADEAKVVSIYPSGSQLPENLLRFYIYFNTPMKKGQSLKHIKLLDEQGRIDEHAFMQFKQELWSANGKRLTILFDPGRIKKGVSTNMLRGPALLEGKRYKLSISGDWQDVFGQKLSSKTTKEFKVANAYRQHLKVKDWVINKPKANSYDIISIRFDRIIDHALIQSMIKLVNAEKNTVNGYWEILEKERLIQFIPKKKWKKGNYQIVIDSRLEDIAGNNLQNLLDHTKTDKENNGQPYQSIEFKIY